MPELRRQIETMWELFEQYRFIRQAFDFTSAQVRDCGLLGGAASLAVNLLALATGCYRALAERVLGVSVFFITMLFVIMLADLLTGLAASRRAGEPRTSKKGLRWVFKLGSYILFIYVLNAFTLEAAREGHQWLPLPLNIIKLYVVFHIALWEIKSIDENLQRMGYAFRIFGMADRVAALIRRLTARRLEG